MSEELKGVVTILQSELDKVRTKLHSLCDEVANQKLIIYKLTEKLDDRDPCSLHVNTMKELNDTVTRMEIINAATSGKVDGFISSVNRLLEKLENDVYKDGGLITTASNNKNQLNLIWGIVSIIFIGGLSMFLWRR